jgi:outer membrane murein-binding lipoprotein Lpp
LDATTLGAVLACVGVLSGSVVAYIGKRGENGLSRFNSVTDQLQEELIAKRTELAAAQTELARLNLQRHDDLIRMTKLEIEIMRLGGTPPP